MPKQVKASVDLFDPYPSAISAFMTIRQIVWKIVEKVEQNQVTPVHKEIEYTDSYDEQWNAELPLLFSSTKSTKKGSTKQFNKFSEYRHESNLYYGMNSGDGMLYPCKVVGVGPSLPPLKYSIVSFIGYGTFAELQRERDLFEISQEMFNDVQTLAFNEIVENSTKGSKYFDQRYRLFSKFDDGVIIDEESWFSVTPEKIAEHIAMFCKEMSRANKSSINSVLDAFSGVGGNSIALAKQFDMIASVDIDQSKCFALKHNAKVYQVASKIEIICDNAYHVLQGNFKFDLILLAPPWGGVSYEDSKYFDLTQIPIGDGVELFHLASLCSQNVIYLLPRNISMKQIIRMSRDSELFCRVEKLHLHGKLKMIAAYFGPLFQHVGIS